MWFCMMAGRSHFREYCRSAWFWVEASGDEFLLRGGGYGHGKGMSQCGAAALAASGESYRDILKDYYGESELLHAEDF